MHITSQLASSLPTGNLKPNASAATADPLFKDAFAAAASQAQLTGQLQAQTPADRSSVKGSKSDSADKADKNTERVKTADAETAALDQPILVLPMPTLVLPPRFSTPAPDANSNPASPEPQAQPAIQATAQLQTSPQQSTIANFFSITEEQPSASGAQPSVTSASALASSSAVVSASSRPVLTVESATGTEDLRATATPTPSGPEARSAQDLTASSMNRMAVPPQGYSFQPAPSPSTTLASSNIAAQPANNAPADTTQLETNTSLHVAPVAGGSKLPVTALSQPRFSPAAAPGLVPSSPLPPSSPQAAQLASTNDETSIPPSQIASPLPIAPVPMSMPGYAVPQPKATGKQLDVAAASASAAANRIPANLSSPGEAAPQTAIPQTAAPQTAAPQTAAPRTTASDPAASQASAPQTAAADPAPTAPGLAPVTAAQSTQPAQSAPLAQLTQMVQPAPELQPAQTAQPVQPADPLAAITQSPTPIATNAPSAPAQPALASATVPAAPLTKPTTAVSSASAPARTLGKANAPVAKGHAPAADLAGKRKADDPDTDGNAGAPDLPLNTKDADVPVQTGHQSPNQQPAGDVATLQQSVQPVATSSAPTVAPAHAGAAASANNAPAGLATPQSMPSTRPEASPTSALSSAQLVQSMHGSEMRLGMHSSEFGSISINTSLNREVLSAQISTEHSELSRALAIHMPAIQEKLGAAYGVQARVEVHNDTSGSQGASSQHPGSRQSEARPARTGFSLTGSSSPLTSSTAISGSITPALSSEARLDIRI